MKGVKKSAQTRQIMSNAVRKGSLSNFWRGGVFVINRALREQIMSTSKYRVWRDQVLYRDKY